MKEADYVSRMRILAASLVLLVAGCPNSARNEARKVADQGNKAKGAKQYDEAIDNFQKAVDKDPDLHPAWWGLGISYLEGKRDPDKAAAALAHCVELAEEQPMYELFYGIALFEKERKTAREDQARKVGKKPEDLGDDIDLSGANFDKAEQRLQKAISLNPEMWRAHYYIGQIYRAKDKAKDAALEFTKAIATNPHEPGPYIGLAELYRRWDYTDEAIKVAEQGSLYVPGQQESAEVWFVLGMAYDDKRKETEAIKAFTKALEAQKDHHRAQFQRGQAEYRTGDMKAARSDLEAFSKSGGASLDFIKQQASKMLQDIMAKSAGPPKDKDKDAKKSPEETVKGGAKGKGAGFKPPKH